MCVWGGEMCEIVLDSSNSITHSSSQYSIHSLLWGTFKSEMWHTLECLLHIMSRRKVTVTFSQSACTFFGDKCVFQFSSGCAQWIPPYEEICSSLLNFHRRWLGASASFSVCWKGKMFNPVWPSGYKNHILSWSNNNFRRVFLSFTSWKGSSREKKWEKKV